MKKAMEDKVLVIFSFVHCMQIAPEKPVVEDIKKITQMSKEFCSRWGAVPMDEKEIANVATTYYRSRMK